MDLVKMLEDLREVHKAMDRGELPVEVVCGHVATYEEAVASCLASPELLAYVNERMTLAERYAEET